MGASPIGLVVVAAAGDEPLRPPKAGTSPFRGGFAGSAIQRLSPQRELSAIRLTEDKPGFGGVRCYGGRIYLPPSAAADDPPLLLRKESKKGMPSCTSKAEGMKTD